MPELEPEQSPELIGMVMGSLRIFLHKLSHRLGPEVTPRQGPRGEQDVVQERAQLAPHPVADRHPETHLATVQVCSGKQLAATFLRRYFNVVPYSL